MKRIVKKEDFYKSLNTLLKDFEIIGPKKLNGKGVFYQTLTQVKDLSLNEDFTVEPMKKFFLGPSCWLSSHKYDDDFSIESIEQKSDKRIIIGARPCEARGLTLLDNVFDSDYKDKFYINNRSRTVIVGLACTKPDENCFCTSLGSSPVETLGLDALLFDLENDFIIETITKKGEGIFNSLGQELNSNYEKKLAEECDKCKALVKKQVKVPDTLENTFESSYWEEVSRSCLNCGICTFLCPTCHCFDLVDQERKTLRCYDGCSFADFTLETSGHNPRPTKKERYRQRVFHKFDYFKRNFGVNLCIGCGRCIRYCPVKIDIGDIVDKVPVEKK